MEVSVLVERLDANGYRATSLGSLPRQKLPLAKQRWMA